MWSNATPHHTDSIEEICADGPDKNKMAKPYKTLVIEVADELKSQVSRDGTTQFKTCGCLVMCADGTVVSARVVFWADDGHGASPGQVLAITNTIIKASEWQGAVTLTVHVNGDSIVQPAHKTIARHMGDNSTTAAVVTDFKTQHRIGSVSIADGNETLVMVSGIIKGKPFDSCVRLSTLAMHASMTEAEFVAAHNGKKFQDNGPLNVTKTNDEIKTIDNPEAASTSTVRIRTQLTHCHHMHPIPSTTNPYH